MDKWREYRFHFSRFQFLGLAIAVMGPMVLEDHRPWNAIVWVVGMSLVYFGGPKDRTDEILEQMGKVFEEIEADKKRRHNG